MTTICFYPDQEIDNIGLLYIYIDCRQMFQLEFIIFFKRGDKMQGPKFLRMQSATKINSSSNEDKNSPILCYAQKGE